MSRSTSRPARYHSMSLRVANEWPISWSRGPRPTRRPCSRGRRPTIWQSLANVRRTAHAPRRRPRAGTRKAGESRSRRAASRNKYGIRRQNGAGGLLQRDEAGLAELRLTDSEYAAHEIHVADVKRECLARSQRDAGRAWRVERSRARGQRGDCSSLPDLGARPRQGDVAQCLELRSGVMLRGVDRAVTQYLGDFCERSSATDHLRRQAVPEDVGTNATDRL